MEIMDTRYDAAKPERILKKGDQRECESSTADLIKRNYYCCVLYLTIKALATGRSPAASDGELTTLPLTIRAVDPPPSKFKPSDIPREIIRSANSVSDIPALCFWRPSTVTRKSFVLSLVNPMPLRG
jgi:hypothetical protein